MRASIVLAVLLAAAPALAQERSPAQKSSLVDLARALGEAQALRRVCSGPADRTWRYWFDQMIDVEQPEEAFGDRLKSAYDAGLAAHRNDFVACSPASRMAEAEAALRGRDLADGLSHATVRIHPDDLPPLPEESVADPPEPR